MDVASIRMITDDLEPKVHYEQVTGPRQPGGPAARIAIAVGLAPRYRRQLPGPE
jgi:hypothetical protein